MLAQIYIHSPGRNSPIVDHAVDPSGAVAKSALSKLRLEVTSVGAPLPWTLRLSEVARRAQRAPVKMEKLLQAGHARRLWETCGAGVGCLGDGWLMVAWVWVMLGCWFGLVELLYRRVIRMEGPSLPLAPITDRCSKSPFQWVFLRLYCHC